MGPGAESSRCLCSGSSQRAGRRPDSSSHSPLPLGIGAMAHACAHALHSGSCHFPSPRASAALPILVPLYLPCIPLLGYVCLFLGVCSCPVHMRTHVCMSPLATERVLLRLPSAATRTSTCILLGYALCLSPHSLLGFVHLPPLAPFVVVNRTDTCIQAVCAQDNWNPGG